MWGGPAAQCSALPTSIPAALGCPTFSPSVQSCDFSFARFFCFDRDLDVDFCDLDFCDLDFCDVDFCVLAIDRAAGWTPPARRQTGDRLVTGAMLKRGHKSPICASALTAESRLSVISRNFRLRSTDIGDDPQGRSRSPKTNL